MSDLAIDGAQFTDPNTTIINLNNYRTRRKHIPLLVSISTAAELLEVSTRTVYRLIDNKRNGIRVVRVGDMRRIEYQSLVEYVARKGA